MEVLDIVVAVVPVDVENVLVAVVVLVAEVVVVWVDLVEVDVVIVKVTVFVWLSSMHCPVSMSQVITTTAVEQSRVMIVWFASCLVVIKQSSALGRPIRNSSCAKS